MSPLQLTHVRHSSPLCETANTLCLRHLTRQQPTRQPARPFPMTLRNSMSALASSPLTMTWSIIFQHCPSCMPWFSGMVNWRSDPHAQLLGSLVNWALYGALTVQICINSFSPFLVFYSINICIDVYSYNFPNDKRVVKYLGEHLGFLTFQNSD